MTLYRRLIRHLARRDLDELEQRCAAQMSDATQKLAEAGVTINEQMQAISAAQHQAQFAHQVGFAQGQQFGAQQAFDAVWREVQERGGVSPFADVMASDIERARQGLIH